MSQFTQEHCKLRSSKMADIWKLSGCIAGLRLRLFALILPILFTFLSFHILHVNAENLC